MSDLFIDSIKNKIIVYIHTDIKIDKTKYIRKFLFSGLANRIGIEFITIDPYSMSFIDERVFMNYFLSFTFHFFSKRIFNVEQKIFNMGISIKRIGPPSILPKHCKAIELLQLHHRKYAYFVIPHYFQRCH